MRVLDEAFALGWKLSKEQNPPLREVWSDYEYRVNQILSDDPEFDSFVDTAISMSGGALPQPDETNVVKGDPIEWIASENDFHSKDDRWLLLWHPSGAYTVYDHGHCMTGLLPLEEAKLMCQAYLEIAF